MPKSKSYQEELIQYLKDPQKAVAYLNAALEEGEPDLFLFALKNVAEAHGEVSRFQTPAPSSSGAEPPQMELHNFLLLMKDLGLGLTVAETRKAS